MTFDPNVPNAGQSPGVFPVQNSTNFGVLKTIINRDHIFNDTPGVNDNTGTHRQVTMTARSQPVALPTGTNSIAYTWIDAFGRAQFMFYDGNINVQMTPGIVAAVNFNGTGAVGAQIIRSQLNVSSVVKNATGDYTINFASPMPNNNYIVQITGMRDSNSISLGSVKGDATYGNSVTVNSVRVIFIGANISLSDVFMGNITVMRYTT